MEITYLGFEKMDGQWRLRVRAMSDDGIVSEQVAVVWPDMITDLAALEVERLAEEIPVKVLR